MVSFGQRIELWTENLDEDWRADPESHRRTNRGPIGVDELLNRLGTIRQLNGPELECLLVLSARDRQLHLNLQAQDLYVSDPQNPNYQNVRMDEGALPGFVKTYFAFDEETGESQPMTVRIIEFGFFFVVLVGLGVSVSYLAGFLNRDHGFIPKPAVIDIENPEMAAAVMREHAGIYATAVNDGEMLIELNPDGQFGYYDLERGAPGQFLLDEVVTGTWKPVYDMGELAFLTDVRFVFHPAEKPGLVFQQRFYKKIADNRDEAIYLAFPE